MSDLLATVTNPDRLAALRRLVLLDTPANPTFDRLTDLAAELLEVPVALITLVDADRQFFLSIHGLPEPLRSARQTALDYSICQHAVATRRPLIVGDTRSDPVLATNAAVTEFGVAAYAGIPLVTAEGHAVGTLCVLDFVVRDWTDDRVAILARLADITTDEIRLHFHDRLAARRREWRGVEARPGR
jgi:GAF domain-containing protein